MIGEEDNVSLSQESNSSADNSADNSADTAKPTIIKQNRCQNPNCPTNSIIPTGRKFCSENCENVYYSINNPDVPRGKRQKL